MDEPKEQPKQLHVFGMKHIKKHTTVNSLATIMECTMENYNIFSNDWRQLKNKNCRLLLKVLVSDCTQVQIVND